ncbi:coiled-coil domain-containing protein [Streptomyces sp. NPDC052396]|uniref:coiled-coil domain-containing protein n=1 Tax=Streptomyces sp. NPDC052396 TaxID=3365689 RepID=UPI0037CED5A7
MSGRLARSLCTLTLLVGVVLTPVPGAAARPQAQPPGQPVNVLLSRLRSLYRRAEAANTGYRGADAELRRQRATATRLDESLARARVNLANGRDAVGAVAREQYRSGAGTLSRTLAFLLGGDVPAYERWRAYQSAADRRLAAVNGLAEDERHTAAEARRAREALNAQLSLATVRKRQRDTARRQLAEVERRLAGVSRTELAELRRLEHTGQ